MALIVFSHANSFAASTYRVLFRLLRARGFRTVIREMGIISIRFGRTAGIR